MIRNEYEISMRKISPDVFGHFYANWITLKMEFLKKNRLKEMNEEFSKH